MRAATLGIRTLDRMALGPRCCVSFVSPMCMALALLACADVSAEPLFAQRLSAGPNVIEYGHYGYGGVATDDVRLAVGEPNGLSGGMPAVQGGAAEVWRFDAGVAVREQRILPPAPVAGGSFASRVVLDGDWLALLDPSDGSARVHLYHRGAGGWMLVQTFDQPPQEPTAFGTSLALRGNLLAIGSSDYSAPASGIAASGAVHLYRLQSGIWQAPETLVGLDPSAQRQLGFSLALGERADGVRELAAGAPGRNGGEGAVYVFREEGTTWVQEQRLQLSSAQAGELLGSSVALLGSTLVAGAPQAMVAGMTMAGRAAIWRRSGSSDFPWALEATVGEPSPASGDKFGQAVALPREDETMMGAPFRDAVVVGTVSNAGAVRLLRRVNAPGSCAPSWADAGGVGNPTTLPQADALYGGLLGAGRRYAGIASIGSSVQSTAAAGAVDALLQDRVFEDAFDCAP